MNGERQTLPVHTIRIRASSPMTTIRSAGGDEQAGQRSLHAPDSSRWRAGVMSPTVSGRERNHFGAQCLGGPTRRCGDILEWCWGNYDRVGQLVFVERPFTAGGAAIHGVVGPVVVAVDTARGDDVDGLGCPLAASDELADADADDDHHARGCGDNQEQPQEGRRDGAGLVTQQAKNVHAVTPVFLGGCLRIDTSINVSEKVKTRSALGHFQAFLQQSAHRAYNGTLLRWSTDQP